MSYFFSPSTLGWYEEGLHGARRITIDDPTWIRPTVKVEDPSWQARAELADGEMAVAPLIEVPDASAQSPQIEIDNPACLIPADAVPISAEDYFALKVAEAGSETMPRKNIAAGADGRPILVDPPPPPPPTSVTMRQARLALLKKGLLAKVAPAIDALPSPAKEEAQIEWDYAAMVDRKSEFVASLSQALGLDSEDLDKLFILAASL